MIIVQSHKSPLLKKTLVEACGDNKINFMVLKSKHWYGQINAFGLYGMPIGTATRLAFQAKSKVYFYEANEGCKTALTLVKLADLENNIKIIEIADENKFRLAIEAATWLCDNKFKSPNPFEDQHDLVRDTYSDFKNKNNIPKDILSKQTVLEEILVSALMIRRAL